MYFQHKKDETASNLTEHIKLLDKGSKNTVKIIRINNGTEFKNSVMKESAKKIKLNKTFLAPRTLQKNRVVERNNRSLIDAARTMLDEAKLPTYFRNEAVQVASFTQNATLINKNCKTPYEMVKNKNSNLK